MQSMHKKQNILKFYDEKRYLKILFLLGGFCWQHFHPNQEDNLLNIR